MPLQTFTPDRRLVRLQAVQSATDPNEVLVNTFWCIQVNSQAPDGWATAQDIADAVKTPFNTWWTGMGSTLGGQSRLQRIDAYTISMTTRKADGKGTVSYTTAETPAATGSPPGPQLACAVTLYGYDPAGFDVDRRHMRGRVYLGPLNVTDLDGTTGLFKTTPTNTILGAVAVLLGDLNNLALPNGDYLQPIVYSRAGNGWSLVGHIGMDQIPDVQTRRVNRIKPVRTYSTVLS